MLVMTHLPTGTGVVGSAGAALLSLDDCPPPNARGVGSLPVLVASPGLVVATTPPPAAALTDRRLTLHQRPEFKQKSFHRSPPVRKYFHTIIYGGGKGFLNKKNLAGSR